MKKILLISLSILFAGEMEVDGGLTVTGQVNASSFSGDGSALTNLPSLGGMKPNRIYTHGVNPGVNFSFDLFVPSNKFWVITLQPNSWVNIDSQDGKYQASLDTYDGRVTILHILSNTIFTASGEGGMIIYEYSISGSGTEQGMDYVIP